MRVLSLSKTVNMLFIAPGDSLLRREAGIMTQRRTHSLPFSFRSISQTVISHKVSSIGRG